MILYNPNATIKANITVSDDSYRYRAIMGENALTLTFSLPTFTDILLGTYCVFQGETYTLNKPATFVKRSTNEYEYTLVMGSAGSALDKYKFIDVFLNGSTRSGTNRVKFSNTAKIQEHLKMLIDNLNIRESGWSVGSYITGTEKTISFNHNNCAEALKLIADTFKTEFEIVGKTISLKKVEYNKTLGTALALSYGYGNGFVSGVKRDNFDSSRAIEKLYVQGGSRNINASTYGAKELLLPKSQLYTYNSRMYASDVDGLYILRADKALSTYVEESLDLSDIYPSRAGTISSVVVVDAGNNFYDVVDTGIGADLDYSACLMPGEKMTIIFQSGMLEGKEFDCDYNHASKRFGIVPVEIDGMMMPNSTFIPAIGDTYAIFGISLPTAYVCENTGKTGASWDMMKEAVSYLYDNEDPKFSFTGELDGIWSKSDWVNIGGKIKLGGYVAFTDSQFQAVPALIRIVGIKDYINNPYSPKIELSNVTVQGSAFASVIGKVEENEVKIIDNTANIKQFARRGFADAKQTAQMLVTAGLNGFTGSISPITVQTMQLLVGDESLQFYFVSYPLSTTQVAHDEHYDKTAKQFISASGYLQHKSIGITDVKSSRTYSDYKTWTMPAFTSAVLDVPATSYYVYAKVNRTTTDGTFILSATAIGFKSDATYYHLLVGILNSETDGDRSYSAMYGFSEITPSRLTTQKIVSPDGKTYFDLAAGEIGGNLKFRASDDSLKVVNTEIVSAQTAAGNALSQLTDIASDGKFTPSEKQLARKEWDCVYSEKTLNDTQATAFGITTEKTAYGTAFTALANYLNQGFWAFGATPPAWITDANLSVTSNIVGADFRSMWKAYYDARTNLINAISAKAKALADASDYLRVALANDTTVSGGLVGTSLLKLGATSGGAWVEMAGMNGVPGTDDTPRIYAGGTLAQAVARVAGGAGANFVVTQLGKLFAMGALIEGLIRTSSSGKRVEIDNNANSISIYDAATLKLQIVPEALPALASLLAGTVTSLTLSPFTVTITANTSTPAPDTVSVYSADLVLAAGYSYSMFIPQMNFTASWNVSPNGGYSVGYVLVKPDGSTMNLGSYNNMSLSGTNSYSGSFPAMQLDGMVSGTYKLQINAWAFVGVSGTVTVSQTVAASPNNIFKGQYAVNKSLFGTNGLFLMQDATHYLSESPNTFELLKGTTKVRVDTNGVDGFGILAMGSVTAGGVNQITWGRYKNGAANATKGGTGIYNVPHTVGGTNYQVFITVNGGNLFGNIRSKSANSFQVAIISDGASLTDNAFDYLIVGSVI